MNLHLIVSSLRYSKRSFGQGKWRIQKKNKNKNKRRKNWLRFIVTQSKKWLVIARWGEWRLAPRRSYINMTNPFTSTWTRVFRYLGISPVITARKKKPTSVWFQRERDEITFWKWKTPARFRSWGRLTAVIYAIHQDGQLGQSKVCTWECSNHNQGASCPLRRHACRRKRRKKQLFGHFRAVLALIYST